MFALWQKAYERAALSPAARAFLRLIEGLIAAFLVAALPVVSEALAHNAVDWRTVGQTAIAAGSVAVLLALAKYIRANGDAASAPVRADAASTLESGAAYIATRAGISDSGNKPASAVVTTKVTPAPTALLNATGPLYAPAPVQATATTTASADLTLHDLPVVMPTTPAPPAS